MGVGALDLRHSVLSLRVQSLRGAFKLLIVHRYVLRLLGALSLGALRSLRGRVVVGQLL